MSLLFFYSLRNLATRKMTTALTALGMGLVVFVFASVLMLTEGLEKTLVSTGSPDNAVAIRKSADTEVQSSVERAEADILTTEPEVALNGAGQPMAAKEVVVLMVLSKRSGTRSNVVLRGMDTDSLALRPQVRVVLGRPPQPGSTEIMVGQSVVRDFSGVNLGASLSFAARTWRVVGVFDAGNTGFSSEIWGDGRQFMQAFRRQSYSSVLLRLRDPSLFSRLKERVEHDPRLTVQLEREPAFYAKQSEMLAKFLRILGLSLTVIFSVGAVVGAMITMFSAVAGRTAEIGTLRALGFSRGAILAAFLMESLLLGGLGGLIGLGAASLLLSVSVSTTNFQTFAELAFRFTLTPAIAAESIGFSLVMGLVGGIIPSVRAARMNLVEALRED
ncbi:MacB-like periplasmic core domain containing protein [Desulfovibrio sp. X2]|uniref:ABC transporter permease n=1 Tax=Desulfovibrio sp. X2 TaxID=941449 RepID=UPI0003588656|nr:ABC transporter permease [Desulfovibrio sp. X2]EPR41217.1 MacB-like periplasmic core domain containing protein [Desulfovibrio sp. X2]